VIPVPTRNLAHTVAWLVGLFVAVVVLAVPVGYWSVTYRHAVGGLVSETEVIARAITQNVVSQNPGHWEFEKVRIEEYLSRLTSTEEIEVGRILNGKNEVVAEVVGALPPPVVTSSYPITDAGAVVGRLEMSRSARPLVMRAGVVGLAAVAAGLGMYAVLWYLPIRSMYQAQNLAKQSEARYRGFFEHADDIIYLLAPDGRFESLSPSFERLTGWHPEKLIGKPFASIVHPDDLPRAAEAFQGALSGLSTPLLELRIARKTGEYFDAELSIVPVDLGDELAITGIARDVSERKHAEKRIRKLNEELETRVQERTRQLLEAQDELVRKEKLAMLGELAGSVSHELRNPLGVMSNAVYFLQTMLNGADASVKEYLGIIRAEIARSELMVASLMDAVHTKPPDLVAFKLTEVFDEVMRKLAISSSVSVVLDIPDALPATQADAMQMQQVFENLVSNAIDAMPEGGTLEIRAREDAQAGAIIISVRDTGSGIAPENMARLFQPLFTTKARGIGLGLVVAKNLVEANGGTLTVQSEVGQGTTFTVTLPAARSFVEDD